MRLNKVGDIFGCNLNRYMELLGDHFAANDSERLELRTDEILALLGEPVSHESILFKFDVWWSIREFVADPMLSSLGCGQKLRLFLFVE